MVFRPSWSNSTKAGQLLNIEYLLHPVKICIRPPYFVNYGIGCDSVRPKQIICYNLFETTSIHTHATDERRWEPVRPKQPPVKKGKVEIRNTESLVSIASVMGGKTINHVIVRIHIDGVQRDLLISFAQA